MHVHEHGTLAQSVTQIQWHRLQWHEHSMLAAAQLSWAQPGTTDSLTEPCHAIPPSEINRMACGFSHPQNLQPETDTIVHAMPWLVLALTWDLGLSVYASASPQ